MSQITEVPTGFVISESGLVDTNYKYPLVQYSKEPLMVNMRIHEMAQWFTDHLEVSPRKYFGLLALRVQYKSLTQQHNVSLGEVLLAMREAGFTQMRIYKGSPIVDFRVKWKDSVKEQWEREEAQKRQPLLPCIACPICNLVMQKKQIKNHYKFKHPNDPVPDVTTIPEIVKALPEKEPNPDVIKCSICKLPTHIKAMEKHMAFYHPAKVEPSAPTEHTVKSSDTEESPIHLTIEEIAQPDPVPQEPAKESVACKTCDAIKEHLGEYGHTQESIVDTVESFCNEYDSVCDDYKKLEIKEALSRCDIDTLRKDKAKLEEVLESTATRLRMFEMLVDELSERYDLEKQIGLIWKMLK